MKEVKINKIQAYRKTLDLTQKEMSKLLNISEVMYSRKERRLTPFTDTEKVKLLNYFKKYFKEETIDSLFF
jgi:DNA-binding helix-turn-helix protein